MNQKIFYSFLILRQHQERYAERLPKIIEGEPEENDKPYGKQKQPPHKGTHIHKYKKDFPDEDNV